MKVVTLKIYSVAEGEFPDEDGVDVVGLRYCTFDRRVQLKTTPNLTWNNRKRAFIWHVTIAEIDFWFYAADLDRYELSEQDEIEIFGRFDGCINRNSSGMRCGHHTVNHTSDGCEKCDCKALVKKK